MKSKYVVAFYEIGRSHGGPEEGGWWYDTGQIVRMLGVYNSENKACEVANRANRLLDKIQRHKTVSSVAYKGGRYQAEVYMNFAPSFYPSHKPTYE
ncbi:MAG TPA: hypothetical protein VGK56_11115 [Anaerolineales bacterium]